MNPLLFIVALIVSFIVRVEVRHDSPFVDKPLAKSGLRDKDITVLVVTRGAQTIPNPQAKTTILQGDELLCFGHLDQMRDLFQA